jgi:pimeloyl-ACP methyl ester carboxylesterase
MFRALLAAALLPLLVACTPARKLPTTVVFPPEGGDSRIVEVPADPEGGFNYEFYLLIPPGLQAGDSTCLLVEPNNTGTVDDRHRIHAEEARRTITDGYPRRLAEALGVLLLLPTFDRPETGWERYTHALDRDTLQVTVGRLARIDLQLIAMIDRARSLLAAEGVEVDPRVLLNGFSASGSFVNRFAVLHPERVRAVASGGVNGMPILPLAELDGHRLIYHVGVADLEELTGRPVDLEAYREVEQFIYMGAEDDNDTLFYDDAYNPAERKVALAVLGESMEERWERSQELYGGLGLPVRFETYAGTGHAVSGEVFRDLTRFFSIRTTRSAADAKRLTVSEWR